MSSTWPAVKLAREVADAADHAVLVAGDIGPTGEILAPLGTLTPEEARVRLRSRPPRWPRAAWTSS